MVVSFSRRDFLVGAALAALTSSVRAEAPRKIVTLEWAETEIALSLGIRPLGVADLAGYRQWVNIENDGLAAATDVGGRQQPSLEALTRLKPDLILTSALRHKAIAGRLKAIAPTVLLDGASDSADLFQDMKSNLAAAATALGREADGKAEWQSFEDGLSAARAKLSNPLPVVIAQPLPGVARLRIFTTNSAVMKTLVQAGFSEAVDRGVQPFGFTTFGLEELASLSPETQLCLLDEATPKELTESAIWPVLPVVSAGHIYHLGGDIWPFGSTRSMARLVERTLSALIA
jgi:iron complex transport system substrate-binding protein